MRIHKILASKDASKKKAHGNTSKQKIGQKRGEEKAKVFENRFRSGGEENERRMANNVMREIGIVMGTWYVDFCPDSSATVPEILLATS